MRHNWILALALIGSGAAAQDFRVGEFRQHRAAAVKAVNAGDFATAETEAGAARAMLPSAPTVLLLGAQIEVAAGKPDAAKPWLKDYLRRGLWFDATRYPDLAVLLDDNDRNQLAANGAPAGSFETVAQIAGPRLVEGIALDPTGRIYLSSVHDGGLATLDGDSLRVVHDLPDGLGGYGLGLRNGQAWLAMSPGAISGTAAGPQTAEVVRIDLADGVVTARWRDTRPDRSFGDLSLGRTDLYVSDSQHGEVLRLKDMNGPFDILVPEGQLGSPQGLVETPDGAAVIVADYTSGLWRIDLATGAVRQLAVPEDASLVGIDGLTRDGDDLIAVQNGLKPQRILRLHMRSDWQVLQSAEILLKSDLAEESTSGAVFDGRYWFVARSQWSDFNDDGSEKPDAKPAIIGVMNLH